MEVPEPPECPVCLQSYEGKSTIPRVLACGHSVCEACIDQLPKPFADTVRCPACTQLVKCPNSQGACALPKNIDLLRLASALQNPDDSNYQNPSKPVEKQSHDVDFLPGSWSADFYSSWRGWILPEDSLTVEFKPEDPFCSVFRGRILNTSVLPERCLLKGNEKVSLLRVAGPFHKGDSKISYSYLARFMTVLDGMKDGKREELRLVLRASCSKRRNICRVYGLWYSSDDQYLYMVSDGCKGSVLEKSDWRNEFVGEGDNNDSSNIASFALIGMEICEAVSAIHMEGVFGGCLDVSCFNFDGFGHIYIDLNEILALGRRVCGLVAEASSAIKNNDKDLEVSLNDDALKTLAFVSPDLLSKLLWSEAHKTAGSVFSLWHASDVWSTACLVLWLLMGNSFTELIIDHLRSLVRVSSYENAPDCLGLCIVFVEKVRTKLNTRLGSDFVQLKEILCKCLDLHQGSQTSVIDIWKCIRELILRTKSDTVVSLSQDLLEEGTGHCLLLGELCQIPEETDKRSEIQTTDGLQEKDSTGRADADLAGEMSVGESIAKTIMGNHVKCIELKGHLDCITGLAIGGGFLFTSSYDKTVNVWSLQDFTQVHTFRGHEHKIMAVVFVDECQPLCASGDNGGGICIWNASVPFSREPIKRLQEEKDWRYSGIHALATAGTGYLYTGSGDKSIKAWSLQDYSLSCVMNGHKSVVSTLAVCNGVLYSGSWDGTIRLWCLSDHSPLTVLGENMPGNVASVLSLAAYGHFLGVAHENGCVKIWRDDKLLKSIQAHNGAIFSISMEGKWLFTGGWDKVVSVQELLEDEVQTEAMTVGSIACNSVITALLYQQGKLFVGQADRITKVYYCE